MFDSTGRQLATEIKGHFRRGCQEITDKLEVKVKRGLLVQELLEIDYNQPTIVNFMRLNKLLDNLRKVVPVSTAAPSFVSFSERELLPLLWKSDVLRAKIKNMAGRPDWNQLDMEGWLMEQGSGRLTSELVTTVGRGRLGRGKQEVNPTGYQRSTTVWSFQQVRAHLETIRREGFNATLYVDKGSAPPPCPSPTASEITCSKEAVVYHNMAVKSKAIYQPILKFRRWLNAGKNVENEGERSIQDIEARMPTMRGEQANFEVLTSYLSKHPGQLQEFYGRQYQKHAWDSRRAMEAEFAAAVDQLLHMVGGSVAKKRRPDNHVLFGIGLGQFSTKSGLTSLHGSVGSYLVNLLRSLGYIVVR
ncbi:hypothetical protein BGZ68_003203, partial [Mortierella alpina]